MNSTIRFSLGLVLFVCSIYFGRPLGHVDRGPAACDDPSSLSLTPLPLDVYSYFAYGAANQATENNYLTFANLQMQQYWAQQQALTGYGLPPVSLISLNQPITIGKFTPVRDVPLSQSHFWGNFTAESATAAVMANRNTFNGIGISNKQPSLQSQKVIPPGAPIAAPADNSLIIL